jgi:hypothetical protein
VLKEVMAFE